MEDVCYFEWKFSCSTRNEKLSVAGTQRIHTIIKCSKDYRDNKHMELENKISNDKDCTIMCHRSCASTYTSKTHVKRSRSQTGFTDAEGSTSQLKVQRRSEVTKFDFKKHCFFCGEICEIEKDRKHPDRWRAAFQFRQLEDRSRKKLMKTVILETCTARNDSWASEVRLRLAGCVTDLPAADAKYHLDCRNKFMGSNAIEYVKRKTQEKEVLDIPYNDTIAALLEDKERIWNSVELHKVYTDRGGYKLSRSSLIKMLKEKLSELIVLSSPGYANVITFPNQAASVLRLRCDDGDDEIDAAVTKIAKQIKHEVAGILRDKYQYNLNLNIDKLIPENSKTLMNLCKELSSKLDRTPPALLIGSIVSATLSNAATTLQVGLGIKFRFSKELVILLNKLQVSCTYDEVLRFKMSAANEVLKNSDLAGILKDNTGSTLTQIVVDNFDTDISSQNGKASTHSLAILATQTNSEIESSAMNNQPSSIKRLKKEDMPHKINYETQIERYNGPDKPAMPLNITNKTPMPLEVLCHVVLSTIEAKEKDFNFLRDILYQDKCPEFNGYNTQKNREKGTILRPATTAVYRPLIDMNPAHPDTIMTALIQAQHLSAETGQEITVFTCDQQLYRVALQITWVYPERFGNVVLRLGGMHLLMSFVGSVGTLMENSGLEDIFQNVFGGVKKMLIGKKFPQNVRALRLVAEEILRSVFDKNTITSYDELVSILETLACKSKTTKLWVDVLIKPVFLMMMYIRAEREGNWTLHIAAVQQMMPYFFAAGHINYARYGLVYLRSMHQLPNSVLRHFLRGDHVMRHIPGVWNGIWSDMFIETTFMRYGHQRGGIIGITLRPETLKIWALSLHTCAHLEEEIQKLCEENKEVVQEKHKEEMLSRIAADAKDREGIRNNLRLFIDPMDSSAHPDNLINIASGRILPANVNVHDTISIGTQQMKTFEETWPSSFHATLPKLVLCMSSVKKHVNVGSSKVFDTSLIYSRVIGLQASSRSVDIKSVLSHELAPIPTSMFTDSGVMRVCKTKSDLKRLLQVTSSARNRSSEGMSIIIDGSALLWCIHWPEKGTVEDYIKGVKLVVQQHLKSGNVYLVFDRYKQYSTKDCTRTCRGMSASRIYKLTLSTPLPSRKVVMSATENKKQLIHLICLNFINDTRYNTEFAYKHKLVLTGPEAEPYEFYCGQINQRPDLRTTHEEADTILVQQAIKVAANKQQVLVISDDTDVFLLLMYFYKIKKISSVVLMESPVHGRSVIDIRASAIKHKDILPDILAAHAVSGCDTTAMCYGIGKSKVIKALNSGHSLSMVGDQHANLSDVIKQASKFMVACYGKSLYNSTSEARVKLWADRIGGGRSQLPLLHSLPPTDVAFSENVKRAHLQTCIWKHSMEADPPNLDPLAYGFYKDINSKCLLPITLPENIEVAPPEILNLIKCSCKSTIPCTTKRCGCLSADLPCTMFCSCSTNGCGNALTRVAEVEEFIDEQQNDNQYKDQAADQDDIVND